MNNTAKNLVRIAGVIAGLGAAAWAMRDRLLPAPEIHEEPPPRFRTSPPRPPATPDDLTELKGIGPSRAAKLHDAGIATFAQLAATATDDIAHITGASDAAAKEWIDAARSRT